MRIGKSMTDVTIYTKTHCPYSRRAKQMLHARGITFTEVDVEKHPEKLPEMIELAGGRRTVPEIFVSGQLIGGSEDLAQFAEEGGLDAH